MGLTRRRDGFYVEFRVLDDGEIVQLAEGAAGGKVKRRKTHTNNRTEAKKQEALRKTALLKEAVRSPNVQSAMTFKVWAQKYLEMADIKALRSYENHVKIVNLQLVPFFGHKRLTDIQADDVEAYRAQRRLKNGSEPTLATVNQDHAILKQALHKAKKKRLLTANPASDVNMPDPSNERDRVLTPEEWTRL